MLSICRRFRSALILPCAIAALYQRVNASELVWGPTPIYRTKSSSDEQQFAVTVPIPDAIYALRVYSHASSVPPLFVSVGDSVIIRPNDRRPPSHSISKAIRLSAYSVLSVRILGPPGGSAILQIEAPIAAATITPRGGTLALPQVGSLTIPADAVSTSTQITLSGSSSAERSAAYDDGTAIFDLGIRLAYDVVVVGNPAAPRDTCYLEVVLPRTFLRTVPRTNDIVALLRVSRSTDIEAYDTYDVVPSTISADRSHLYVALPPVAFRPSSTGAPPYTAVLTVSSRPVHAQPPLQSTEAAACAITLRPPVAGPMNVDPNRRFKDTHDGLDIQNVGDVFAAASGRITKVRIPPDLYAGPPTDGVCPSKPGIPAGQCARGYGYYIVIKHDNDGGETLYAHLEDTPLLHDLATQLSQNPTGVIVHAGDRIGTIGASGGATGPHLHFEYAPVQIQYGQHISRADPEPCLVPSVSIESVAPPPGTSLVAETRTNLLVRIGPSDAALPQGARLEATVRGHVIGSAPATGPGDNSMAVVFPNFRTADPTPTVIRLVQEGKVLHEIVVSYLVTFNWAQSMVGPWAFQYDWTFAFASKVNPDQTGVEHSTGNGYVGTRNNRASPFPEHYSRAAWVNSYDFSYDGGGRSYLEFSGSSPGPVLVRLQRDGYSPPLPPSLPPNIDLRNYLKYFYVPTAEGPFVLSGSQGFPGENAGALQLVLNKLGTYHVPNFVVRRTYREESNTNIVTHDLYVSATRIPWEEYVNRGPGEVVQESSQPATYKGAMPILGLENVPNPFGRVTCIQYRLPTRARVSLKVFSVTGALVATLVDEVQSAGNHRVNWDGSGLPPGVYVSKIENSGRTATRRMVLVSPGRAP